MDILVYKDLSYSGLNKQYKKTIAFLKNDDFVSADIKKMKNTGFYRAKLDYENRLLFRLCYFGVGALAPYKTSLKALLLPSKFTLLGFYING